MTDDEYLNVLIFAIAWSAWENKWPFHLTWRYAWRLVLLMPPFVVLASILGAKEEPALLRVVSGSALLTRAVRAAADHGFDAVYYDGVRCLFFECKSYELGASAQ